MSLPRLSVELPDTVDSRVRAAIGELSAEVALRSGQLPRQPEKAYITVETMAPGGFTLLPNLASSPLRDKRIGKDSVILIMPTTANAATALATTYFNALKPGQCVVNHANNAQTDRTFRYTVIG